MNKIKCIPLLLQLLFLSSVLLFPFFTAAQETPKTSEPPTPPALPTGQPRYIDFFSSPHLDFAIDVNSIVVQAGTEEKEIRYTLKATSKQGAVNVSYEGIRCDNRQKIIYAIGHNDGSWKRVRSPEWSAIYITGINRQHADLANSYFCDGGTQSGNLESIRNRFIFKRPLR